jgi:hypothetical protein
MSTPLHDAVATPPGWEPTGWTPPPEPMVSDPAAADPVTTTSDIQRATEGVVALDDTNSIEFMGERFGLAESIALMPLLKFAHSAKSGLNSDDMEGLNAMYLLIRSCIDRSQVQAVDPETGEPQFDEAGGPVWAAPSQWDRFENHAIETNADGDDLSELISRAIAVIAARPRKRRGASSASSPQTSESSRGSSSSPGIRRPPPGFEGMVPVGALGNTGR